MFDDKMLEAFKAVNDDNVGVTIDDAVRCFVVRSDNADVVSACLAQQNSAFVVEHDGFYFDLGRM
jgi:hypothetical protein